MSVGEERLAVQGRYGDRSGRRTSVIAAGRDAAARVRLVAGMLGVCLLGAVALSPAQVLAATGHSLLSRITEAPPGTTLSQPEAVAVDNATGDVFVASQPGTNGLIQVFNSAGAFKTSISGVEGEVPEMAVDSSGRLYVADRGADTVLVYKANRSGGYELLSEWTGAGVPAGPFVEVAGVTVDDSTSKSDPAAGDVYVVDSAGSAVDVFKPRPEGPEEAKEGEFLSVLKGAKPKLEEPNGVAVDSATGTVYVANASKLDVAVFSSAGVFERKVDGKGTPTKAFTTMTGIAVEEATGDLYVADGEGHAVDQFNPAGEWIGWITVAGGPLGEPRGVAVAPDNHVYVSDFEAGVVDVFGANALVPDVTSSKASKVERNGATLNGSINPDGEEASYHFEYGETEAYGSKTPSTPAGSGAVAVKVQGLAEGLKPATTYDFRLVGENSHGTSYGANLELETPPAVTGVTTGPATSVQPESATLTGSLEPEGIEAEYHFEYGETTAYGNVSPVPDAKTSGTGVVAAETAIGALRPNTTYHFRLLAKNSFGTTPGADAVFTTSGPPRVTSAPSEVKSHTSETVNAQINPGKLETKYRFEYGETSAYGASTPEGVLLAGEAPVPVKAELTGLKLATTYHYRVVAINSAGEVQGPDQEFATALIESESAKDLTPEGATLQAEINPLGIETTYRFEYGETTAYTTSAPVPDGLLGKEPKSVEAQLAGLHPNTTYHYRVVATLEGLGSGSGPDHTFTTPNGGVAFQLPDNRAYEMVSPPEKHGGAIEPIAKEGATIQAAEDGNALTYDVNGPIVENPEGNRGPEVQQVIAERGLHSWSAQQIVTPHDRAFGLRIGQPPEYQLFSSDLALGLAHPFPFGLTALAEPPLAPPLSEAERGHQEKTVYLRADAPATSPEGEPAITPSTKAEAEIYDEAKADGEALAKERGGQAGPGFLALVTGANVPEGTKFGGNSIPERERVAVEPELKFVDATSDLTHVVLQSSVGLARTGKSAPGLYEWAAGTLQMVSVLPDGTTAEQPTLGVRKAVGSTAPRHAISADGTRLFWTSIEHANALGHLYMSDMTRAEPKTIQIDTPETAKFETGEAQFQFASADGSRVFFTDTQNLTKNSSAAPAQPDLYECEVVETAGKLACNLTDLTFEQGGEHASVQGLVLGASEDGSYVYIVATGALAPGGESGAKNLYVLNNEAPPGKKPVWTTRFIARLSNEDAPDWFVQSRPSTMLVDQPTRVSPSGQYLTFMSSQRLTGYDNTDVNEVETKESKSKTHADEEVFEYHAGVPKPTLTCVSCNPSGARPRGVLDIKAAGEGNGLLVDRPETWEENGNAAVDHWLAGSVPGWTTRTPNDALYQSRYLSESGRMFFTSADPLVPQAAAHTRKETIEGKEVSVGVENVYQYEPNGVGSCTIAAGCIALISSGTSERESAFLDASATGEDVFFVTAAQLSTQDTDSTFDIYDARVCTEASPCQTQPPQPSSPCGSIETCRGASPPQPAFGPPVTATFSGPGNTTRVVPSGGALPAKSTKLTQAQRLALALKACRKLPKRTKSQRHKRAVCEAQARKRYGAKKATKARHPAKRSSRRPR